MSIKKIAILVMIGIGALTTIIVVPIVVLSNKEDQKDVPKNIKIKEMQTSLNNLNLILPKGKDYSDETKILRAIKTALENRTNIDASHTTFITSKALANNKISLVAIHNATPTLFTIVVGGEEFILKLNQAQYTLDEHQKINKLKASLSNLKIILPKNGNYSNETQIFKAIKIKLETRDGIDASHIAFITSKTSANSKISSVAIHGDPSTKFTIVVGNQEFILQLNQAQHTSRHIRINELKVSLNNLKVILPKSEDYSNESNIFEAIKVALKKRVGIDDSHIAFMTSKPSANSGIASVAAHGATPTSFVVVVNEKEFILQLNQAQYTLEETKINKMQASLSDLNLIFPNDGNYSDETKILEAIKIALQKRKGIDASHTTFITSKASVNSGISSIATHEATPTTFTINVGDQEFVLKLKISPFTSEQIKINELKNSLTNLKVTLPKGGDYSNESNIFEAIKVALKTRTGIDASHIAFITSKPSANSGIASVAEHGETSTQFTVIVDGEEFILKLNQAQYDANEKAKINDLKNSLTNLKVTLPKGGDYSNESNIFEAIKVILKARTGIDASHIAFITSKPSANSGIASVATHGATSTQFTVIVDGEEFILKLNQVQYDANEITKINDLKNSLTNLKVTLPKGGDYSNESNIFEAIKVALKARTGIDDSHIAFITSKPSANSGIASVAEHGATSTQFTVIVDGEEFILKLNQVQYDANEKAKINDLKNSLTNLKVTLPKAQDYNSESNIFEAIKVALKARTGIDASHIAFITSKPSANSGIASVAEHGETSTQFTVIVDGQEFILQLNQAQYDANEKAKINDLKNSLDNLKVTLPKAQDYNSESNIFEAIKVVLKARDGIDDSHIAFITSKPLANSGIASVATHGATSTQFIVIVDGEEFILQLNQAQYDANEKAKINELKNSLDNLKVTLPKAQDYNSESNIFEAIKIALKARDGIDDSHLDFMISKSISNSGVALVAAHGATSTQFIVIVDGQEFILQLNQAQYDANEKAKINDLKNSLTNLKVTLPKGGDYSNESNIFEAIKIALKARDGIYHSHLDFMTSKASSNSSIASVAAHGATSTQFIVIVDGQEFILQLNQAQYDANEITKIIEMQDTINFSNKIIVPKGEDYSSESNIFEAVKTALKKRDGIDDSHLALMTSKTSANSRIALVAAYGETSTQFTILFIEEEFVLQLNQSQFTLEQTKISELKESLSNLKVMLPKGQDYSNESKILEVVKTVLKARVIIDDSHLALMTSKTSANSGISLVAAHGVTPTQFIVIVDGEEFILKLNQSQFTLEQTKISELKDSLRNLEVMLPKGGDYSSESNIFEATKAELKKRNNIDDSHIALMTSKTSANNAISSVAAHGVTPTQFIVIVDGEEFILKLNQSQFTLEQTKISELKHSLKNSFYIYIPKGDDYSNASLIFKAVKTALKKRHNIDDSHIALMTSKTSANNAISSVAAHGVTPTQFIVIVDRKEFVLSLNQAKYTILEKFQQINKIKEKIRANLNLIMPKKSYDNFYELWYEFQNRLNEKGIAYDAINKISFKDNTITEIAPHGATPTLFPIAYGGEYFVFKLNQAE